MDRSNHYEAAFEAYLQCQRLCYIAVHEGRRTFAGETRVKNLDFIVHGKDGFGFLVDVKGRRFPSGNANRPRRVWECWSTQDDVDGLQRWAEIFGDGYCGLLVFVYLLGPGEKTAQELGEPFNWRGQRLLLRAVPVEDYRQRLRVRSPRWGTVHVSSRDFLELARPFHYFTHEYHPAVEECPF
jgi:hypothetical protein